jgi:predicted nucleotidyltransferase
MIPQHVLDTLVERIVGAVHPRRIILFGSAARNEMRADSDLDVLVVMPDGIHRRATSTVVYQSLRRFGYAIDIVVATEGDLSAYADNPGLVFRQALLEGKELYHAA